MLNSQTNTKMEKFARMCSVTGEGMNEGFVIYNGEIYMSEESDLIKWLRSQDFQTDEGDKANLLNDEDLKEWAYDGEIYYWTEWEDEDDYQYEMINGVLTEIED